MLIIVCQWTTIIVNMTNKHDDISKKIGTKIKLERVKRNWSQEELAEKADLSKNHVGAIERGTSSPTVETLAKIADAFGIPLNDLTDVSKVEI